MEDQAEKNRARYPSAAALIDEVRRHFPEAKVTRITEMDRGELARHKIRIRLRATSEQ